MRIGSKHLASTWSLPSFLHTPKMKLLQALADLRTPPLRHRPEDRTQPQENVVSFLECSGAPDVSGVTQIPHLKELLTLSNGA